MTAEKYSKLQLFRPIFIGGCPRSGTTMLGYILGLSSRCIVTPESQFKQTAPLIASQSLEMEMRRDIILHLIEKDFRFKIWDIKLPELDLPEVLMIENYRVLLWKIVDEYAKQGGIKDWNVWIDHTPRNIKDSLMLSKIFSNAKFIHLVRDPRAVAASLFPLDWGPNTPKEAALYWINNISYGLACEQNFTDKCMRVFYEDIVLSPEKNLKRICNFCEIEFDPSMLNEYSFRIPKYTQAQHTLVGSSLNVTRINSWQEKLSIWDVYRIESLLGDLIELMGYQKKSFQRPSFPNCLVGRVLEKTSPLLHVVNRLRIKRRMERAFRN